MPALLLLDDRMTCLPVIKVFTAQMAFTSYNILFSMSFGEALEKPGLICSGSG